MNTKELLQKVGENTIFKFSLCHDNIFYFESITPSLDDVGFFNYSISLYVDDESNNIFHEYNTLESLVRENQICEIRRIDKNDADELIYFNEYKNNK